MCVAERSGFVEGLTLQQKSEFDCQVGLIVQVDWSVFLIMSEIPRRAYKPVAQAYKLALLVCNVFHNGSFGKLSIF